MWGDSLGVRMWVWAWGCGYGYGEGCVGVMWGMGADYGACEDRGCGNKTIQKVVETPGTMLGAVQLGIHFSCPLESMTLPGMVISRIHFTTLCTSVMCNV